DPGRERIVRRDDRLHCVRDGRGGFLCLVESTTASQQSDEQQCQRRERLHGNSKTGGGVEVNSRFGVVGGASVPTSRIFGVRGHVRAFKAATCRRSPKSQTVSPVVSPHQLGQTVSVMTVSSCSYAGAQQHSNRSVSAPVFQSLCRLPGGIAMASPARTSRVSPSMRIRPVPCVR